MSNQAYRRPSVSIGMGFDGADFNLMSQDSDKQGGFVVTASLPFKRDLLFSELLEKQMLGNETDTVKTTIIRPGNDPDKTISIGCVRESIFLPPAHGRTISEIVEIREPGFIKWATLVQDKTPFYFVGRGEEYPSVAVQLKENKKGTTVQMKYEFAEVSLNGHLCIFSFLAADLLKWQLQSSLSKTWIESMRKRGHYTQGSMLIVRGQGKSKAAEKARPKTKASAR